MRKYAAIISVIAALLVAALVGGGCNGSSSGSAQRGNVRPALSDKLDEVLKSGGLGSEYDMVGAANGLTDEQMTSLGKSYQAGKSVVLHGASEATVDKLRAALGIAAGETEVSSRMSAKDANGGPALPEIVMFRKVSSDLTVDGVTRTYSDIYEGAIIFIDGKNGGAEADVTEPTAKDPAAQSQQFQDDYEPGPRSSDAEIARIMEPRSEDVHFDAMIESLKGWHGRVTAHNARLATSRDLRIKSLNASGSNSADDDLASLANAYIKQIEWNFGDIKGGYKFPTIYQTITIYSCYSYDKDEDWHLIETSSSMNPQDNYKHWTESGLGGCDWVQNYTRRFKTWAVHQIGDKSKIWLQKHLPQNMNNGYTNTDSFSWNVGGSIGFNGSSPTGAITGGVTVGNSTAYTVHDYNAQDQTDDKSPNVTYEFDLPADGDHHFDYQELKDASDISRYNFTSQESWIWNLDHGSAKADRYKFNQHVQYWSGESRGNQCAFGVSLGNRWDGASTWKNAYSTVTIPTPPTLGTMPTQLLANAKGRTTGDDQPVKFDVLSGGDWSATCDADWVKLTPASGKATGNTPISVLVEIDENTGSTRTATITVKGTRKQVGTITVSQEGAR